MDQFELPQISDSLLADEKVNNSFQKLTSIIDAIKNQSIPEAVVSEIQACLFMVEQSETEKKAVLKTLKKANQTIIKLLEKHLKLVPKNYYKVLWTSLGLAAFGIPIGLVISTSFGNMAFLGIGMPFGILIGMAMGSFMDKKAASEGRQLPIELV